MTMTSRGEFRKVEKIAREQGWDVVMRANSHLAWLSPTGDTVWSAFTPSDHKAVLRHIQIMKRYGFVPRKK